MNARAMNSLCVNIVVAMLALSAHAADSMAERITRIDVGGIDVIIYPMDVQDVVTLYGNLPAGDFQARGGNITAGTLTAMLLDKGTVARDKFAIAKQLDDAGAQLYFYVDGQMLAIDGKSLKKDLPMVMRLLAEELRTPVFTAEELAKARTQLEASLKSNLDDTEYRAQVLFSQAAFPANHPNHPQDAAAWLAALEKASLEDVKAFHQKYYGPSHLTLVFAGDVDAELIQAELTRAFAGWRGGVAVTRDVARGGAVRAQRRQKVAMRDKTSVSVLFGQGTGLRYADADTLALRVGTAALGSGFTGRLMKTVRDRDGLTYGIDAVVTDDVFVDGTFTIGATFAPSLLEKGMASTRREFQKWYAEGITASELAARKSNLIGSWRVRLSDSDGVAGTILRTINRGKPLSWLDDYPKAVEAVTLEQVNRAIKKYLKPKSMILIEAGTFE